MIAQLSGRGALVVLVCLFSPAVAAAAPPWMDPLLPPDLRADLVVAELRLDEKVGLATGVSGCVGDGADGYVVGVARLGIPDLHLVGAGMGVSGGICPNRADGGRATLLPAPIAMAASWSPDVAYEDGALIGRETRDTGFNVSIGGAVNLARDPRSGRTFEGEGEDPLLAGTIVGAQLRGTQDQHVVATIKHYALNNEEAHRLTASSEVDERTMRELELRAFELGLARSGAGAVMCSYNKVNGVPACENGHLLTDVLKRDWAFPGWVMSDWWACTPPAVFDSADQCSTMAAARAGLDQQQPNASYYGPALLAAVALGRVPATLLDGMVHRILRSMFAAGIVDDPPVRRRLDAAAGARVAQHVEEQSAVLLKNDRATLPLRRDRVRTIAVLGAPAGTRVPAPGSPLAFPSTGDGSSVHVEPLTVDTPLDGVRAAAPDADVRYSDGRDHAAAARLAAEADVAIVYARDKQGEGLDLPSLTLDDGADALIAAVAAANPRTVVVLMTGTAATMPWIDAVPAVLEAWYPGARGGHAIGRLLFGDVNPSGRLPLTFPAALADLPTAGSAASWPGDAKRIDYAERLLMGYRWYDAKAIAPLFAFGHGLSYGPRVRYSRLRAVTSPRKPGTVRLAFDLTNRDSTARTETAQVYATLPAAAGEPPRRLVAFRKVSIAPKQRLRVRLTVAARDLSIWIANRWAIVPGRYRISVGRSSRDLPLRATVRER